MPLQWCRLCGSTDLHDLWQAGGFQWSRCCACGCDSSDEDPTTAAAMYDEAYIHNHHGGHTLDELLTELRSNLEWFGHHASTCPDRTFLDVGHNEGAALRGMQDRGWAVHGFDINPHANLGSHTTIAPHFHADLFPRRYSAILCREVIEHVPGPRQMVEELYRVTAAGGLCQIQTPRPTVSSNPIGYQRAHLQLFTPVMLRLAVREVGFNVLDEHRWELGFALLLRR